MPGCATDYRGQLTTGSAGQRNFQHSALGDEKWHATLTARYASSRFIAMCMGPLIWSVAIECILQGQRPSGMALTGLLLGLAGLAVMGLPALRQAGPEGVIQTGGETSALLMLRWEHLLGTGFGSTAPTKGGVANSLGGLRSDGRRGGGAVVTFCSGGGYAAIGTGTVKGAGLRLLGAVWLVVATGVGSIDSDGRGLGRRDRLSRYAVRTESSPPVAFDEVRLLFNRRIQEVLNWLVSRLRCLDLLSTICPIDTKCSTAPVFSSNIPAMVSESLDMASMVLVISPMAWDIS